MASQTPAEHKGLDQSANHRITAAASTVFYWGFRISLAVILIGLVVAVVRDQHIAAEMGSPSHVFDQALHGNANGILGLGMLVMIVSPFIAIVSIAIAFLRIGDKRFALFSTLVALVMIVSAVTNIGG